MYLVAFLSAACIVKTVNKCAVAWNVIQETKREYSLVFNTFYFVIAMIVFLASTSNNKTNVVHPHFCKSSPRLIARGPSDCVESTSALSVASGYAAYVTQACSATYTLIDNGDSWVVTDGFVAANSVVHKETH